MKFIKKFLMMLLICIAISEPVFGMYSWTDENGAKHFSDAPPPGDIAGDVKVQKDYGDPVKNEKALYEKAQQLLGDYRGNTDDLMKAGVLLARILEFNPNSALAYTGLSRFARKQGRIIGRKYRPGSLEKSREFLLRALTIEPTLYDAHRQGVYLYIAMNNLPEAKKAAIKAHEIAPNDPRTDLLFIDIAWEEGRDGEVIKRANSVISGTADRHILYDAYFFLSKVYKKQKKYDLVEDIYLKTMNMLPTDAWNIDAYAAFLESQGRRDEAIAYGEKAISVMDFPVARNRLGILYYKKASDILWTKQQPENAIQLFLASVEHHPTANAYYGLGTSYALAGRKVRDVSMMKKAGDALEKALELNPDHELAKKQLADVNKVIAYEQ